MNAHELKITYIKSQIDEYTDSRGDVDSIDLIDHVALKYDITVKEAEALVDEALGYE